MVKPVLDHIDLSDPGVKEQVKDCLAGCANPQSLYPSEQILDIVLSHKGEYRDIMELLAKQRGWLEEATLEGAYEILRPLIDHGVCVPRVLSIVLFVFGDVDVVAECADSAARAIVERIGPNDPDPFNLIGEFCGLLKDIFRVFPIHDDQESEDDYQLTKLADFRSRFHSFVECFTFGFIQKEDSITLLEAVVNLNPSGTNRRRVDRIYQLNMIDTVLSYPIDWDSHTLKKFSHYFLEAGFYMEAHLFLSRLALVEDLFPPSRPSFLKNSKRDETMAEEGLLRHFLRIEEDSRADEIDDLWM